MAIRCLIRRHEWEQHPAFEGFKCRRCIHCPRVEADVFHSGWRHRPHLDGLTVAQVKAMKWRHRLAEEVNRQLQRRGDPRAIW